MKTTLFSLAELCLLVTLTFLLSFNSLAQTHTHHEGHTCGVHKIIDKLRADNPKKYAENLKTYQKHIEASKKTAKSLAGCPNGITVIPVAFHVFHPSQAEGTGYNFSKEDLLKVIDHLNADFSGYNSQKSLVTKDFESFEAGHTCIQFTLGKINRINTASCPNWKVGANHRTLNKCLPGGSGPGSANDPNDYLNVYFTDLKNGALGIASSIPYLFGTPNGADDGVTVDWKVAIPGNPTSSYNRGAVLTHEVGHWIGLPHVNGDVQGYGCDADDGFSDTYPQLRQQFYRCSQTTVPASCNTHDNVFNFMDYSVDCAKLQFTKQQRAAMHRVMTGVRSKLSTSYTRNFNKLSHGLKLCLDNPSQIFKYIQNKEECESEVNLLERQKDWFPSPYQSHSSVSGLNVFTWKYTTTSNTQLKTVDYLAKFDTKHDGKASGDFHNFIYLYHKCWDPFKKAFTREIPIGIHIETLNPCGAPSNDKRQNAEYIATSFNCNKESYTLTNATPSNEVLRCSNYQDESDVWFMTDAPGIGMLAFELTCANINNHPQIEIYTVDSRGALVCKSTPTGTKGMVEGLVPGEKVYIRTSFKSSQTDNLFDICLKIPTVDNNICQDALELSVTSGCNKATLNNSNATASGVPSHATLCGRSSTAVDVWYKVVVPSNGQVFIETFSVTGGITEVVLEAYEGRCGNLQPLACSAVKDNHSRYQNKQAYIELTNRIPGEVIYIRMLSNGVVKKGNFEMCVSDRSLGRSCRINLIEAISQSECDGSTGKYTQQLIVHHNSTSTRNKKLYINNKAYALQASPQVVELTDLTADGKYVHVKAHIADTYDADCGVESHYEVYSLFRAPEPCATSNLTFDECGGALELTVGASCNAKTYNNEGATFSSNFGTYYRCGSSGYKPRDVWFKATVPASGELAVSAPLLFNGNNMILEAYAGSCHMNAYIACDQFGGTMGSEISLSGRTPGEVIYIRVADQGNNSLGDFSVCAYDPAASGQYAGMNTLNNNNEVEKDWYFDAVTEEIVLTSDASTYDLTVFPNPTTDYFTVETNDTFTAEKIELYALSGQLIKTIKNNDILSAAIKINVEDVPSGQYLLTVSGGGYRVTNQMVQVIH